MHVLIVGAGVAGTAASLLLARAGHDVTVLDRDGMPDEGPWVDAPFTTRPGCPQLNQGHAFLARGYRLLQQHLPDVVSSLVEAGANLTDANLILPPEHHDPALVSLAVRRPLIDAALMAALRAEASVRVASATVTGVIADGERDGVPVLRGVRTREMGDVVADLVVDATGRRTKFPSMLQELGCPPPTEQRYPCGGLYYGRYFRIRPGRDLPVAFAPIVVRGSLGYGSYTVFWQDERILVPTLSPPADDPAFRRLNDGDAFLAAARAIRQIAPLVDADYAEPISPVVTIGGLQNVHRSYVVDGRPLVDGFVAIGDALSHTDPRFAFGMSMGLDHAAHLAALAGSGDDDVLLRFHLATDTELRDRYRMAAGADAEQARHAAGEPPDPSADGDREFVLDTGIPLLAGEDPGVLVPYLRRLFALDPPSLLDGDERLLTAASEAVIRSGKLDRQRRPTRDELLAAMGSAG